MLNLQHCSVTDDTSDDGGGSGDSGNGSGGRC